MMSRTSAAVALATTVSLVAVVSLVALPVPGVPSSVMGLTTDFQDLFKGVSILSITAIAIYLIVKFEIIVLFSVQEGTVAIRTSWGRPRFYRTDLKGRKGRLLVLHPGRHLMVKGLHGLVIVNLRVDVLEMPKKEMTYRGRTLVREGMIFKWRILYEDNFEGDLRLLNRIWYLADGDVRDGSAPNYRQQLVGKLEQAISEALPNTPAKEDLFPDFKLATIQELVSQAEQQTRVWVTGDGRQLLEENKKGFIFPELLEMEVPAMAWTEAQIEADAEIKAAKVKARATIKSGEIEAKAKIKSARILAGHPETVEPEEDSKERQEASPANQSTTRLHLAGESDLVGTR